ncbi:reticulon-4-interacting protein 1, mitochondrial precursor [Lindgomyces ingoldianus]|uniref:Reticulon-4-interacting protein 1, mitochondrial n=1 Tax=Lindgomyces ingoldianus TaxID=673940 RepID=A0ACB6QI81_9PLEO|nr:reticulon-4-interacting protein 1, mitochondrial precursor [Lindgomyces ingoldianus]KAF2466739.1 reticulon-4-interacting protein 1, mitochondrial precursor [Lindgomyces ingoldianus]
MPSLPSPPSNFKSLTYTQPSTTPHLTHQPLTPPSPNELLIKVKAAAINPVDLQLWGNPLIGWLAGKKEKGIGRDYSGTIVGVGSELKGKWEEGVDVFGLFSRPTGGGTFSQYIKVTSADPICKKPTCWSHQEAAAVPLVTLTAFACLDWLPPENKVDGKRRVVVAGASGGVGMWCVQLAKKLYNCHVTGICSSKNADFVRRMGADEIIDYTTQDVAQTLLSNLPNGRKFDEYIDCVGGTEMFSYWHDLLHRSGAYITIVGDKTSRTSMGGPATYFTYPSQVLRYLQGWIFGPRYANVLLYSKSGLLEQIADLAGKGNVEVVVQEVVKGVLNEGSLAWKKIFEFMEGGRVRGKIVINIE